MQVKKICLPEVNDYVLDLDTKCVLQICEVKTSSVKAHNPSTSIMSHSIVFDHLFWRADLQMFVTGSFLVAKKTTPKSQSEIGEPF